MAFEAIIWDRPWLTSLRELGEPLSRLEDWIPVASELATARDLQNLHGQPICFRPQEQLPASVSYESYIAATGEVPTRDNLHDFFNTLMWLHMPAIKRELNALHTHALNVSATAGTRGHQRDAATLFDENAALVVSCEPVMLHALREHDWMTVLLKTPDKFFNCCDVLLFGHALIEKLVAPYKSITAHVWTVEVEPSWFDLSLAQRIADLDHRIAERIRTGFASSDFCHLPVLGVPSWWAGQDRTFYEDAEVFRPKRLSRPMRHS